MGRQRVGDYGMCCRIAGLGVAGRLVENVFPRCWWLMFDIGVQRLLCLGWGIDGVGTRKLPNSRSSHKTATFSSCKQIEGLKVTDETSSSSGHAHTVQA